MLWNRVNAFESLFYRHGKGVHFTINIVASRRAKSQAMMPEKVMQMAKWRNEEEKERMSEHHRRKLATSQRAETELSFP
jgi:hypothetical protein